MAESGVDAAIHTHQMVESLKSFRELRTFLFREQTVEFEGKARSVYHFAFGFPWMDGNSVQGHIGMGGVKGCRSDFPVIASINRVGVFGPEFLGVKMLRSSSDFFIRGK